MAFAFLGKQATQIKQSTNQRNRTKDHGGTMKGLVAVIVGYASGILIGTASSIRTHGDFIGSWGISLALMGIAGFLSGRSRQ